jgi:hypothetical protein
MRCVLVYRVWVQDGNTKGTRIIRVADWLYSLPSSGMMQRGEGGTCMSQPSTASALLIPCLHPYLSRGSLPDMLRGWGGAGHGPSGVVPVRLWEKRPWEVHGVSLSAADSCVCVVLAALFVCCTKEVSSSAVADVTGAVWWERGRGGHVPACLSVAVQPADWIPLMHLTCAPPPHSYMMVVLSVWSEHQVKSLGKELTCPLCRCEWGE